MGGNDDVETGQVEITELTRLTGLGEADIVASVKLVVGPADVYAIVSVRPLEFMASGV